MANSKTTDDTFALNNSVSIAEGVLDLIVPAAIAPPLFARFGNFGFFSLVILLAIHASWLDLSRSVRH